MELCVVLGDRCVNIDSLIEEGIGLQTLSMLTLLRAESWAGLATTNELGKKRRDFTPDELPIDF